MGILVAATIATLAALLLIGGLISWRSEPAERSTLILLVLAELPLSPILFYGIRQPLEVALEPWGNAAGVHLLSFLARPIIEELLKLWPLLVPFLWKTTDSRTRLWRALAIGLGFGIGEIWMLAEFTFRVDPATANLDLLKLTGFINERVMVCVIHGALTLVALSRFGTGLVVAMGLHLVGNLPFYLQQISAFGLAPERWATILRVWIVWYFVAMAALPWAMSGGDLHIIWLLFGDATCPFCGMIYPRATLGWGMRVIRHDRCPRCNAKNPF